MSSTAVAKIGFLTVLVGASVWIAVALGIPDLGRLRSRVDAAGSWGPALFFGAYAALALLPVPRPLLTIAGAALFGFWAGAGLALGAALVSAVITFWLGRLLGRDAVRRLAGGRMVRGEALLGRHGLSAVIMARLAPVVPYLAVNYGAGLLGVRFRHFALGSALGLVPGSLAYAAVGTYGTSRPGGLAAAGSVALVILFVGGTWAARRHVRMRAERPGEGSGAG